MDAIIPAAGLATRMRGLPKYLLPSDESYTTLIERHINELLQFVSRIWIATRPESAALIDLLGLTSERVVMLNTRTQTMSETCLNVMTVGGASSYMVVMPDTFFFGEQPYEFLSELEEDMRLAVWDIRDEQIGKLGQIEFDPATGLVSASRDKDRNCSFPHSWGAMSFTSSSADFLDAKTPHTGYLISELLARHKTVRAKRMNGSYFDCGTPREYFDLIKRFGTI